MASRAPISRASSHSPPAQAGEGDGQAQRHEDDDLPQAGQRGVEALDVALVGRAGVPHQHPGDEDGQEPGAVGHRRDAVDEPARRQRAQRVQARPGQRDAAHHLHQPPAQDQADREAHGHLHHELGHHVERARARRGGQLEQAQHQRDPGRVVGPRLALEDGAGAALHLLAPEDREHDRRVGRSQRGPEQPRRRPPEVEDVVGGHGHQGGGGERPDHPEGQDGHGGPAHPAQPQLHAAREQDDDERHRGDALDAQDREVGAQAGEERRGAGGAEQEDGRLRDRDAAAGPAAGSPAGRAAPPRRSPGG